MRIHVPLHMRVMLACPVEMNRIRLPLWGSVKLDGIRATVQSLGLLSRSLTRIPNKLMIEQFEHPELFRFDGELVAGSATDPNAMQHTQSVVMSGRNKGDVTYHVFDLMDRELTFERRYDILQDRISRLNRPDVVLVTQRPLTTLQALGDMEEECVGLGYEGLMLRRSDGLYRPGRRSMVDQELMKVKRTEDSEAVITGVVELFRNLNEATVDARGLTKRSSSKKGKVPAGTLGSFDVKDIYTGKEFNLAGELSAAERAYLWSIRETLPGRIVVYKHFTQGGVRNLPRQPIFKSFRDIRDLDLPKKKVR